jgi:hypothetical protein
LKALALLLFAIVGAPALLADEHLVFVGRLEWTKLIPKDWDSPTAVATGNSCGESEIRFHVQETLMGPVLRDVLVSGRLGEWCQPVVPISRDPVLVWARRKDAGWSLARVQQVHVMKEGRRFILPEDGDQWGPVSLAPLRRPLAEPAFHSKVGELAQVRLDHLVQQGILRVEGTKVYFRTAVSVDELKSALQSSRPR